MNLKIGLIREVAVGMSGLMRERGQQYTVELHCVKVEWTDDYTLN